MGRETGLRRRSVAVAGINVNISVGGFAIAVDDVFAVECGVLVERIVRPKVVGIDGQRLLLAGRKQESNRQFIGGFRWDHVAVAGAFTCGCFIEQSISTTEPVFQSPTTAFLG